MTTEQQYHAAVEAARADGHRLITPSHLVLQNNEIIGAGSLGNAPVLSVWTHTKKVSALQSMKLWRNAKLTLAQAGHKQCIMPCSKNSPYYPHMNKFGFSPIGDFTLFWAPLI